MWKVYFSYAKPQILIAFYYPEMLTTKIYVPVKKKEILTNFTKSFSH